MGHNGSVSLTELGDALRLLGHNPIDSDVEKIVERVQMIWAAKAMSPVISFDLFVEVLAPELPEDLHIPSNVSLPDSEIVRADRIRNLKDAFRALDRTGDGTIDIDEYMHFL